MVKVTSFACGDSVNPVIWVPVLGIVQSGDRSRKALDPEVVDRLKSSLQDVGLLMPIGVTPSRVLIFGSTRLEAARQLGWDHIEAREFESAEDPHVRRLMEWEENMVRKDLTLLEQLDFKKNVFDPLMVDRGISQKSKGGVLTAAARWGNSSSNVGEVGDGSDLADGVGVGRGRSRDLLKGYIGTSGKTMEKFEFIADVAEDVGLPEEIRVAAVVARDRANVLGKVDGEFKVVKALVNEYHNPTLRPDPAVAVESLLTNRLMSFVLALEGNDPVIVTNFSVGGWEGLKTQVKEVIAWMVRAAEHRAGKE